MKGMDGERNEVCQSFKIAPEGREHVARFREVEIEAEVPHLGLQDG